MRSRTIGGGVLIDAHILVEPEMTVTEGHQVAETARRNIIKQFSNAQDVLVHVAGEHDAEIENLYKITRRELIEIIKPLTENIDGIEPDPEFRTHHVNGKITVDIFLQINKNQEMEEAQKIIRKVKSRLETTPQIDRARVFIGLNFELRKPA